MTQQPDVQSHRPVALITGGARRLGAAICAYLARQGFAAAVHYDRSAREARELCRAIAAQGGIARPFQADLLQDDPADLAAQVGKELGPVALLVNNASIFKPDALGALQKPLWDAHFRLHMEVPVLLAQAVARLYPAAAAVSAAAPGQSGTPSGLIVNMIDQRVLRLNPQYFSYTLSKAALWTATQTMAQSLAPHWRVNAIGPGPSLKNSRQSAAEFAGQCAALPMGRGPDLADFGRTICYLWQMPAITGQMIALDGGQHLIWQTPDVKWDAGSGAEAGISASETAAAARPGASE